MLTKHKNNIFITLTGFAFIALIGFLMLTKTGVSFAEKSVKENGPIITLNFHQIPLDSLVQLIADQTPEDETFLQSNLMEGKLVNVAITQVYAFDILDQLLKDNGLQVDRQGDTWQFSEL